MARPSHAPPVFQPPRPASAADDDACSLPSSVGSSRTRSDGRRGSSRATATGTKGRTTRRSRSSTTGSSASRTAIREGRGRARVRATHRLAGDHRADRSTPAIPLHLEPVPRRRRGRRLGGRAGRHRPRRAPLRADDPAAPPVGRSTARDRPRGARARPSRARDPPCGSAPRCPAAPPRLTRRVDSADGSGSPPGCASGPVPRPAG